MRIKNFVILALVLLVICQVGKIENEYTMSGVVCSGGLVEDTTGNLWGYDTELPEGTEVTIVFDNAGTPQRGDDIVLRLKKQRGGAGNRSFPFAWAVGDRAPVI